MRPLSTRIQLFCLIAFCLVCLPALAQDATPAAPAADTKALMRLTAITNSLSGFDVTPWHIKATFKLYDAKGGVSSEGSYEEFWVSPSKFKRVFTSAAFTQTIYGTANGILLTGMKSETPPLLAELRGQFIQPFPASVAIDQGNFANNQRVVAGSKLDCLSFKDAQGKLFGPIWCASADQHILRIIVESGERQMVHNRIQAYKNNFIAGDLGFVQKDNVILTAHLESIEPIPASTEDSFFQPPADATPPQPRTVSISADDAIKLLVTKVAPEYPADAQKAKVTGTVVVQLTIGKDGHTADLKVISGPQLLQQAALDAVKKWVYKPYEVKGEAVAVETTANILFSLGDKPKQGELPVEIPPPTTRY